VISGLICRRNGPAGIVLAGAPGVGKTRLAREALAAAQRRGALTRWAVATASARALPLGAFAATLGVVGPDPARLVRQASDALLAGADKAGVIVGVDDAHLLDDLSATLVHQLVLRRTATLVLTLRTGETAPDAVTALWKDGHLTRLELQPLSQDETAVLVGARLSGPVDAAAARRLWSITQGNALYLRQLVDSELEASRLEQVAGVWRWSGQPTLSPGLVELVSARIGQLPDAQRCVVDCSTATKPRLCVSTVTPPDAIVLPRSFRLIGHAIIRDAADSSSRLLASPRRAARTFMVGSRGSQGPTSAPTPRLRLEWRRDNATPPCPTTATERSCWRPTLRSPRPKSRFGRPGCRHSRLFRLGRPSLQRPAR
jgi:hypothetical protein